MFKASSLLAAWQRPSSEICFLTVEQSIASYEWSWWIHEHT